MPIQINPFENDIVANPRELEPCVQGLNEGALHQLLEKYEIVSTGSVPRRNYHNHAWLITSAEPGYGKSYLIGRLFKALEQKAVPVYIRPFQNPSTCWKSILSRVVNELKYNNSFDTATPVILEQLSHCILTFIFAKGNLMEDIRIPDLLKSCDKDENRRDIFAHKEKLISLFTEQLELNGIKLHASSTSWLNLLLNYTFNKSNHEIKDICLAWLYGESIYQEEAKTVGISRRDVTHPEFSSEEINEICYMRVVDLCHLAGFFKPLFFCFDQTENFGRNSDLVRAFGIVIESLTSTCPNQVTVVAANQHVWEKTICNVMEQAHTQRLRAGIDLEGINKEQAGEFVKQRLSGHKIDKSGGYLFINEKWIERYFENKSQVGIRAFIQQCRKQWDKVKNEEREKPSIGDYFEKIIKTVGSQPKKHIFDPDIFYWLVLDVANGVSGISAAKHKTEKGYFEIQWQLNNHSLLFGFESDSNCNRWGAIAREATRYCRSRHNLKTVMLRAVGLPVIPLPTWEKTSVEIEFAIKECLNIIYLAKEETLEIYAANQFYMDAVEGDTPFLPDEVLLFVRKRLGWFWDKITGRRMVKDKGEKTEISIPDNIINKLTAEVKKEKLLRLNDLITNIQEPFDKDLIIAACRKVPQIAIHKDSETILLQWLSNP